MLATVEGDGRQSVTQHPQHQLDALEVESGLRQHGLAGEQRLRDLRRHSKRPLVMAIAAIREGHQEAGVRDSLHGRLNPFRAGQVPGAAHGPGEAHEGLAGRGGPGPLELVADQLALRHAGLGRGLLQPVREVFCRRTVIV